MQFMLIEYKYKLLIEKNKNMKKSVKCKRSYRKLKYVALKEIQLFLLQLCFNNNRGSRQEKKVLFFLFFVERQLWSPLLLLTWSAFVCSACPEFLSFRVSVGN